MKKKGGGKTKKEIYIKIGKKGKKEERRYRSKVTSFIEFTTVPLCVNPDASRTRPYT